MIVLVRQYVDVDCNTLTVILEIQYLFILSQVLIWEKYWIGVIQVARGIETLGYWIFIIGDMTDNNNVGIAEAKQREAMRREREA